MKSIRTISASSDQLGNKAESELLVTVTGIAPNDQTISNIQDLYENIFKKSIKRHDTRWAKKPRYIPYSWRRQLGSMKMSVFP